MILFSSQLEAKIGTLIDTRTNMRVQLPVANETSESRLAEYLPQGRLAVLS